MFGYITANQPEMKIKDFKKYRSYYCGLCHALKKRYGFFGRISLSYDMTFVAMLLSALYEPKDKAYRQRCAVHPAQKQCFRENAYTDYVADMNILLSYHKCLDNWSDDHKLHSLIYAWLLRPGMKKVKAAYPEKADLVKEKLDAIRSCEERGEEHPDIPAGLFGDIMAEILIYKEDAWEADLRQLGFFLGKYIYLLDAYDDMEEDRKTGNYNVLLKHESDPDFEKGVQEMLTLMMGECAKAFERLPILRDAEILRNIIYSGVWTKFALARERKNKKR